MATIILMWNPKFSSYKKEQFEEELSDAHAGWTTDYNWSIHEYDKAKVGDRFYMVKVGQEGKTGIVMSGTLSSEPYILDDWAGKNRIIHYMDMEPDYFVDIDKVEKYFSTSYLMREFPGFDWTGGHAGRVLPAELVDKLEEQWARYTKNLHDQNILDGERAAHLEW